MTLKIATWNVNSVRIRTGLLKRLMDLASPDIICLQETKVEDHLFPMEEIKSLGFSHVLFSGQKSYNGVAILSKLPLEPLGTMEIAGKPDKRHIAARLPSGAEVHNFYVPAGGDIPDPVENPSYDYKLRFVEEMTRWAKQSEKENRHKTIIMGDFNIAPLPEDVWSHKQLLKVVSHTPPEIERLDALKASRNWCDAARHFVDPGQKLYSWWSYRNRDWKKSDRGRRLDHVWVTPDLTPALKQCRTFRDARDWESPSDHVPVMIEINL
jgi:exodeoxyribonuclease III